MAYEANFRAVYDDWRTILYDITVDGQWFGSRRTFNQCEEAVRWHTGASPDGMEENRSDGIRS